MPSSNHGVGGGLPSLGCACANLRRAGRAVTQLYDEALRPEGLRTTQFTLLQVLARAGSVGMAAFAVEGGEIDDHAQRDLPHGTAADAGGGLRLDAVTAGLAADRVGLRTS